MSIGRVTILICSAPVGDPTVILVLLAHCSTRRASAVYNIMITIYNIMITIYNIMIMNI